MPQHIELNPLSHLTVSAVGEPGKRVFYLQGSKGRNVVSLIIEKQQAAMLAASFESLLADLAKKNLPLSSGTPENFSGDMRLREPLEPLFRVGNLGLGYSDETNKIVVVAYELVEEGEDPNMVSFWASPEQVRGLISQIDTTVKAGRPICGNCGEPIDPEGHFCPRRNGHHHA